MKKKRAANFSPEEKDVLLDSVLNEKEILFGKVTLYNDWPQKNAAWLKVLEAVNNVSYVERSLHDIRRKLKDLKASTRKKYMDVRGELKKMEEATPEERKILTLLGTDNDKTIKSEIKANETSKSPNNEGKTKEEKTQNKRPLTRSQSDPMGGPTMGTTNEPMQQPVKRIKLILRRPEDHTQPKNHQEIKDESKKESPKNSFFKHTPIKVESFAFFDNQRSESIKLQDNPPPRPPIPEGMSPPIPEGMSKEFRWMHEYFDSSNRLMKDMAHTMRQTFYVLTGIYNCLRPRIARQQQNGLNNNRIRTNAGGGGGGGGGVGIGGNRERNAANESRAATSGNGPAAATTAAVTPNRPMNNSSSACNNNITFLRPVIIQQQRARRGNQQSDANNKPFDRNNGK